MSLLGEGPHAGWSDEQLTRACLDGEQAAWDALLHKYKRMIYSIPFRYGASADDAGDIFQTVCIDLYNELPRLRKVESLRSWLMTVTARHSLRWKKRHLGRKEDDVDLTLEADPASLANSDGLVEIERAQMVHDAIGRLSERCATMIRRLFLDDPPKPYDDLARELGLATGSIGFNRGRCLEKLRKLLEEMRF
jgi:RNA polymerase sigma factor (sigma-70 family)